MIGWSKYIMIGVEVVDISAVAVSRGRVLLEYKKKKEQCRWRSVCMKEEDASTAIVAVLVLVV